MYEKGAEIIRIYDTLLGQDGFRRGMVSAYICRLCRLCQRKPELITPCLTHVDILSTGLGFMLPQDLYFKRHDGHAVTCDDFLRAMEMPTMRTCRCSPGDTHFIRQVPLPQSISG